jgi:LmbE family N-acetylglucosaminyl deacetylase
MVARVLMAVHAHPDDEVISTGGILARYSREGVRTVLVTCTDGSQGFGPHGELPGEPGHDLDDVAAIRRRELDASCAILGVSELELLGYRDSGMAGWAGNDSPDAFANAPLGEGASRLAALIERYEPAVVVTYDAGGGYGHPDHVQTHRIAVAALEQCALPKKLYFTARNARSAERMAALRSDLGLPPRRRPEGYVEPTRPAGSLTAVTTVVDTRRVVAAKRAALQAHASQLADTVWVRASDDDFTELFGEESFARVRDDTGAPLPETDLLAGL